MVDSGFGKDPVALLSDSAPMSEAVAPKSGNQPKASRIDHQHPRLTSSTRVQLTANGTAAVTYTRAFAAKPAIVLTAINPSGRQVVLEVISDTLVDGAYTGCVIKGYRSQMLPSLSGILLIGPLITALSGFDVLGGSAAGVEVSVIAIQPSN